MMYHHMHICSQSSVITPSPDCAYCQRQSMNPLNNFVTKWKYRDDPPRAPKPPKKPKVPKTVYHFPLSSFSINTSTAELEKEVTEGEKEKEEDIEADNRGDGNSDHPKSDTSKIDGCNDKIKKKQKKDKKKKKKEGNGSRKRKSSRNNNGNNIISITGVESKFKEGDEKGEDIRIVIESDDRKCHQLRQKRGEHNYLDLEGYVQNEFGGSHDILLRGKRKLCDYLDYNNNNQYNINNYEQEIENNDSPTPITYDNITKYFKNINKVVENKDPLFYFKNPSLQLATPPIMLPLPIVQQNQKLVV